MKAGRLLLVLLPAVLAAGCVVNPATGKRQISLVSESEEIRIGQETDRAIVEQMRDEEEEHGESAAKAGAAELPAPVRRLMQMTAKVMTRTAYWV